MEDLLYVVAIILVILWLIGFFVYSSTILVHLLLVLAVVTILLRVIKEKKH